MSELKKAISENIRLVFNNEQSFIDTFAESDQVGFVYSFFMGSSHHSCDFEWSNGGTVNMRIDGNKFEQWKSTLNKPTKRE
tara:strand:- start:143 stop:385 length:243 start_codon:yes stop_codon:yes gene_type:complete